MTETTAPRIVTDYLRNLRRALATVPPEVRDGIVDGISEELEGLDATVAAERIDALGDPEFIAAGARAESAPAVSAAPPRSSRLYVAVTTLLVALGGIVFFGVGWLVGIVLMWRSPLWSRSLKLWATVGPAIVGVLVGLVFALAGGLVDRWHAILLVGGVAAPTVASIVIALVLYARATPRESA